MSQAHRPSVAVLFDWNGTVVLDRERARDALNQVLTARGLDDLDDTGFGREFRLPMADMFQRLGVTDVEAGEIAWNEAMAAGAADARDGVTTLWALREAGVRLGVVSAAFDLSVRADIASLEMDGLWDSVDAPAADKLAVLRARRGDEDVVVYVGDTAYDMQCAAAVGYLPVAVSGGYSDVEVLRAAGAARVIDSFAELETLVQASVPASAGR